MAMKPRMIALVTGASSGIGRASAELLANVFGLMPMTRAASSRRMKEVTDTADLPGCWRPGCEEICSST